LPHPAIRRLIFTPTFRRIFSLDQIHGNMPDNSQIRSTVSFASPVAIFVKGDIKHPMKIIFKSPMRSHHTLQSLRIIGIKTADKIACFLAHLVADFSFGRDRDNTLQALSVMPLL
jgi:hypothetical protein